MYDVIVVGAGPVGSQVAYRLAGMGHEVVVLERKARLGEGICCTGIVGQECITSFGIDDSVILREANSARVFSPSGKLLHLQRAGTQAVILERGAFDRAMAERARNGGVEYRLGTPVSDIEVLGDRVRVAVASPENKSGLEAKAVVIAAGFANGLTQRLGLGTFSDAVFGAQMEVPADEVEEVEVYFGKELAPGFFAWLVPTVLRRARVGLLARQRPDYYLRQFISRLVAQKKIRSEGSEPDYGGIPLRPLKKTFTERLLVVGEAAGQVKPTSGGGIYYGLLCADIAADVLHRALERDLFSEKILSLYERRWRKRLGRELELGYWARKIFERLSDSQIDRIFDIIKARRLDQTLLEMKDLSFDWHGNVVLALLRQRAISSVARVLKRPLPWVG